MFYVIQSNDTNQLVNHLIDFYKENEQHQPSLAASIFSPFTVIVPSMVLGDWLTKTVASKIGISTLFVSQFWGKYQWQLIQKVLQLDARYFPDDTLAVPEVAVLSASIMRWRIFGFLSEQLHQNWQGIVDDDGHPLNFLLKPLVDKTTQSIAEHRLWQVCDELAGVYVRYLTHRPQWLFAWARGQSLKETIQQMMAKKAAFEDEFAVFRFGDELQEVKADQASEHAFPDWLQEYYLSLERLLGFLWHRLFGETYLYRISLEERFWQVLKNGRGKITPTDIEQILPKKLYLFTVQQIPQVELEFLQQLSLYVDVVLLHFNPSMLFWADIVDKNWLLNQRIIKPQSVYLKDYGHGLLSRLGKESRETFAMLADMSGGQFSQTWQIDWQDDFISPMNKPHPTLLDELKQDILMLDKDQTDFGVELLGVLNQEDLNQLTKKTRPKVALSLQMLDSLSIHACHSLRRQLEIARLMIAKYLNEDVSPKRQLSDVVVLLPDVANAEDLIRSVFPEGRGVDGLYLPIKITGVPDKSIDELMRAILGFYELLGEPTNRFYAQQVYEWLLTPALFESFNLTFEQMHRACDLLDRAGFRRGFNEEHLSLTLDESDLDYRYSFSYALDRIVLGFLSPSDHQVSKALHPFDWQQGVFAEAVLPLAGVSLADEPIVAALTAIYQGLSDNQHKYHQQDKVENILECIEHDVINRYFANFHQTVAMRAIFNTKNIMMASLRANKHYHRHLKHNKRWVGQSPQEDIVLSYKFVLQSLTETVKAQAISAEPSEAITFARFGALRSIPFGLTVMLDMNLSAFPRQDKAVRMDLMYAGLKQRGDRYHEDDDNGAFLDALLCSKDKVLIFYNGISADGKSVLLPASPVGELIEFFKTDALWKKTIFDELDTSQDEINQAINDVLPNLIEQYLITYHDVTAFDDGVFYDKAYVTSLATEQNVQSFVKNALQQRLATLKRIQKQSLPPPPLWQEVRAVLDDKIKPLPSLVDLPSQTWINDLTYQLQQTLTLANDNDATLSEHLSNFYYLFNIILDKRYHIKTITHQINHLAKTFLAKKIMLQNDEETTNPDEPLALDGLQYYQLTQLLLQIMSSGVFDDVALDSLSWQQVFELTAKTNTNTAKQTQLKRLHSLYYADVLPVGVSRLTTPNQLFCELQHITAEFTQTLTQLNERVDSGFLSDVSRWFNAIKKPTFQTYITKTYEQETALVCGDIHTSLVADLPKETPVWLNIVPNSARATHLFGFWVRHLLWQVARKTTMADVQMGRGSSVWRFYKSVTEVHGYKNTDTFALPPITCQWASAWLLNLLAVSHIAQRHPLVMTTRDGLNYMLNQDEHSPNPLLFKDWLHATYQQSIRQDSSLHKNWQMVLSGSDPYVAMVQHLPLVEPLFGMMAQSLIQL